jgi:hypothetical protein
MPSEAQRKANKKYQKTENYKDYKREYMRKYMREYSKKQKLEEVENDNDKKENDKKENGNYKKENGNDKNIPKKNNKWKLISRLKALSKPVDDINDIWNQWILHDTICTDQTSPKINSLITNWNTHSFNDDSEVLYMICLCSHHPIYILNLMKNKYTNEKCIIGSCCIKKFASAKLKTDMKIKIGNKKGKRYCEGCKRKLPDDFEEWKTYHKTCWYNRK